MSNTFMLERGTTTATTELLVINQMIVVYAPCVACV